MHLFSKDNCMKTLKSLANVTLLASILMTGTAFANVVKVYKSIGPHGEVRYSQDVPRDAKNLEVMEFRSDGRTNTAGQMAAQPIDPNAQQNQQMAQMQQQIDELKKKENAQRCQALRNNLANLNIGGKIYEMDANGNRSFLGEQEIASRRDRTQQAINQFCNN